MLFRPSAISICLLPISPAIQKVLRLLTFSLPYGIINTKRFPNSLLCERGNNFEVVLIMSSQSIKHASILFLLVCLFFLLSNSRPKQAVSGISENESVVQAVEIMKKWGQAERKIMNQKMSGNEIYAKGKTIRINRKEVEIITARYALEGNENGEEAAYKYLVRREALHQIAVKNGYTVSQQEAQEYVNGIKEDFESMSDTIFSAYLEGMGMSVSDYWDSQYEILKNELLTDKYLKVEKEKYAKAHKIVEWTPEEWAGWQKFLDNMAQQYINSDDVKKLP